LTFSPSQEGSPAGSSGGTSIQGQGAAFPTSRQGYPVWSPDGKDIAFASNRSGDLGLYETAADGTGATKALLVTPGVGATPYSWSPDGRYIAYMRTGLAPGTNWSVWILPLFGDRKPFPLVRGDFNASKPQFSPDGRWLAYVSDESGQREVYVTSFPSGAGKWRVSASGGDEPRWRGDGRELFYLSVDNTLTAAEVKPAATSLQIGALQPLFQTHAPTKAADEPLYDVAPDGQRFLVTSSQQQATVPFTLVVNWPALLEKK
jgi:eukaryotic-like serine/threonine-protein kinase